MISVVDYEVGNIGAVLNMLARVGAKAEAVRDPALLAKSDGVILPGVGAFDHAMKKLAEHGLTEAVKALVARDTPLLGICIGMQMLGAGSEEGSAPGLGLLPGFCRRFVSNPKDKKPLKVPHMGWTELAPSTSCPLFAAIEEPRFYFVHSYHLVCEDAGDVAASADYGSSFTAAVQRKRLFGVQFHPEKSHRYGMALLKNFSEIVSHGSA